MLNEAKTAKYLRSRSVLRIYEAEAKILASRLKTVTSLCIWRAHVG